MFGIGFDLDARRWTAPLWLAALDDEVVARSAALLGYPEGLRYVEAQSFSPTLFGFVSACATFLAAYLFAGLLYLTPTRWLLTRLRPPGSGPNRRIRERGHGTAFLVAKGATRTGLGQVTYVGEFRIPGGDPGYQETAKMLVGEVSVGNRGYLFVLTNKQQITGRVRALHRAGREPPPAAQRGADAGGGLWGGADGAAGGQRAHRVPDVDGERRAKRKREKGEERKTKDRRGHKHGARAAADGNRAQANDDAKPKQSKDTSQIHVVSFFSLPLA